MSRATKSNNWGADGQGFLSDIHPGGDFAQETPNGVIHSGDIRHRFTTETPPQEHQGALNAPSKTGNRGGTAGSKPVIKAGL